MHDHNGIFDILLKIANHKVPDDFGVPNIANATPVPFTSKNFHELKGFNEKKLCFVDGGNNTIFLAPGHSIQLVRLYYSLFDGSIKKEYNQYTFVLDSHYLPGEKKYVVNIYDLDNSGIYDDETASIDENALGDEKIRGVGAYIRRIGEWLLMDKIAKKCDYVIRDGSLQTRERDEYIYQEPVFESVKGIMGLSKTCSLVTSRGISIVAAVNYLSKKFNIQAPWYYNPLAKNITTIKGDMFVVKLHPHAEYSFRAEIYPEELAEDIISALIVHSDDPTFLGYPYGLLDADINARISDEEIKMYRSMVYDYLDDFSKLEQHALDAHDIISEVK